VLRRLLEDGHVTDPGAPVFSSATGRRLSRFGIYKRVRQHAAHLESTVAARSPARRITPHVFRHTAAVHLLEAGVEVNVIRGWLGHVSLETTNRYAKITERMKEAAMKLCEPTTVAGHPRKPMWRDDPRCWRGWHRCDDTINPRCQNGALRPMPPIASQNESTVSE
jgi:integrase/recombinase XerD